MRLSGVLFSGLLLLLCFGVVALMFPDGWRTRTNTLMLLFLAAFVFSNPRRC